MNEVTAYIQAAAEGDKAALQHLCDTIRTAVPEAEESTSYGMPAFRYKGKALAGFAVTKKHIGFCPFSPPAIASVADKLAGFGLSKGMVRFTPEKELPQEQVTAMVLFRKAEIDAVK